MVVSSRLAERANLGETMGLETVEVKPDVQVADETNTSKKLLDPFEFLQTFPNAPSRAVIDSWKQQAPNGIIRLFSPGNAKRVYLVRGITGYELKQVQSQVPENLGANLSPEARAAKIEGEISVGATVKCVVWTSETPDGKLTKEKLEGGSAGLPSSLFNLITYLSDFLDPEALNLMSAEL